MTELRYGSATDVGLVRANNQDRFLVANPLFAVADGMGGHAAGEVASATAVAALRDAFTDRSAVGLAGAARAANRAVWDLAQSAVEFRGMGTTLVALALVGPPGAEELAIINVGDSRLYLLRRGVLTQVTTDHSLVGELVAEGTITEAEAEVHPRRHVLTRALGVDPDVAVDLLTVPAQVGDRYLLCSDGLSREVPDDQVASILDRLDDPEEAAQELVSQAKDHGGNDNVTVVVVDVSGDAGEAGAPIPRDGETVAPPFPAPNAATPFPLPSDGTPDHADAPTTALRVGSIAPEPQLGWWARRRARKQAAPSARLVTLRVVAFFGLLLALVAIAVGGVAYYARDSYYVGLQGSRLVIFQGRPGGVLWFQPTLAARTGVTTAGVLPVHRPELRAGKVEDSLAAARQFVANLHREYLSAKAADTAPTTTVPTTVPTTLPITVPTSVGPATAATVPTTAAPVLPGTTIPAPAAVTPTTVAPAPPGSA